MRGISYQHLRWTVSAVCLILSASLWSQWIPKRHFTMREGLAQSQVTGLVQDAHGYLWASTLGGVCRFDGRGFVTFTTLQGLPDDVVGAMVADSGGGLWMGTDSGPLAYWDGHILTGTPGPEPGRTCTVTGLGLQPDGRLLVGTIHGLWRKNGGAYEKLLDMPVQRIVPDPGGGAWVLADQPYLCRGNSCEPFPVPPDAGLGTLSALSPFQEGLWLMGGTGRLVYIEKGRVLRTLDTPALEARSLLPVSREEVWLGGRNGLWRCDGAAHCSLETLQTAESEIRIGALLRDHEGSLWIGTWGSGLYQQTPHSFSIFDLGSGMRSSTVWNFAQDPRGCIWMASNTAGVFSWCEGIWGPHLSASDGLPADRTISLLCAPGGSLWIGTDRGAALWNGRGRPRVWSAWQGAPQGMVTCMVLDRQGALWAGTMNGLARYVDDKWTMFAEDKGMPSRLIRGLALDRSGELWIATRDAGVVHWDGRVFTTYGRRDGLPNERVWCLMADSKDRLWAGTDGGYWIHPLSGGANIGFSDVGLLPSLNILFLLEDREGMVWAGTTRGVARISPEGKVLKVFTAGNGFSDSEAAENAALMDGKGRLWFGMSSGVTRVDSLKFGENPVPPPLVLERLLVNGREEAAGLPLSLLNAGRGPVPLLESGAREVRFEYSALSFMAPDQVRYRFRLEGYEPGESRSTEETHVTYRNLPPGRYRFLLRACNNDGVWVRDPLAFAFTVRPAWYQTWRFRILAGAFLLMVVGGVLWLRASTQRRLRRHLEEQVKGRTVELSTANQRILEQNRLLEELSRTDPLTSLCNRRVMEEQLPLEMAIHHRELERVNPESLDGYYGMALLMVDLDDFKSVNDRFGHDRGDDVLKQVAAGMQRSLREIDQCARWGGEEFVILCRQVNRQGLLEVVRRLLKEIAGLSLGGGAGSERVTASIGGIIYPLASGDHLQPKEWPRLLQAADLLLYAAKKRGKARACGIVGSHWSVPGLAERDLLEHLAADPQHPPQGLNFIEILLSESPGAEFPKS